MSDPERLIDTRAGLARTLLESSRQDAPGPASLQRALATVSVAAAATAVSGSGAAAASATALWVKWLGIGAAGGLMTMGVVQVASTVANQPTAAATNSSSTAVGQNNRTVRAAGAGSVIVQPSVPVEALELEPPAPVAGASSGSRPSPEAARDSLTKELAYIDAARGRLRSGNARGALSSLDDYAREYPKARFGQEALLVRIESHIALGQCAQATALGSGFLKRHAKSAFGQRVRSLLARCGNSDKPPPLRGGAVN